jgi:predicted lipid-binding transport protein (Tim44 family)
MIFDPFNLLLLGVALVIFWRLKATLGSRTGNERPPFDPYAKADSPAAPEAANGNVLRLPKEPVTVSDSKEPAPPVWTGFAKEGSALAKGIAKLAEADPNFTPQSFIQGAKTAYEMILEAFARGDKGSLNNLLSKDVFDGFAAAIDARNAEGQKLESRFVGIEKADLQAVALDGKRAAVTVNFVSEIISATLAKDGSVIEGDQKEIREVNDVWTFERDTGSRDPNWKLASTQAS